MATNYPKPDEKWLEATMKTLDLTREEALEVWMDDHDIDAGKVKPFDLDPAKQAVVKQMTKAQAPKKPANYSLDGKPKRERKADDEKRDLISKIYKFIREILCESAEIVNPEREIKFNIGENHYSLTLTRHRPPKK